MAGRTSNKICRLLAGAGILLVLGGASLCLFYRCGGKADTAGAGKHEAVAERAQAVAGEVKQGIDDAQQGVRRAGENIAESLDGVGVIRSKADTIVTEISRTGDAIADIEAGIRRIDEIIQTAQQRKIAVEGNCGNTGGDDGRNGIVDSPE